MDGQDAWGVFVLLVVSGFLGWQGYRAWKRPREMRALANRVGMDYLDDDLPNSLTLDRTSLANVSAVWHVLNALKNGARIVVFDCRIGTGKGSWRQTVIAVESDKEIQQALAFNPGFTVERSGSWQLIFEPRESLTGPPSLIPIEELEPHIENVESVLKN